MNEHQESHSLTTEALRAEAYRLAQDFQNRAARPDATTADRDLAEIADLIIQYTGRKAELIPRDWATADLASLKQACEKRTQALAREILLSKQRDSATIAQLQTAALTDMDKELRQTRQSLNLWKWDAWHEACEELRKLRVDLAPDGGA